MTGATTVRTPAITPRDIIRNKQNRIACLMLKKANETYTAEDQKEFLRLQKDVDRLQLEVRR